MEEEKRNLWRNLMVTAIVAVIMAAFVLSYAALKPGGMGGTATGMSPAVTGYAEGQEVRFIHTEASDPAVAQMLTNMTGSRVLVVPSLAQARPPMLADVYVFKNGVGGSGPFGFQPDVFNSVPGEAGYSPLRVVNLVTWYGGQSPRVLKSTQEVLAAQAGSQVTIERTSVVVNMPMVTWPGGQR
jgi:hypothetical protein